jgi:tetratricopeptide (TPR) repeat protein
MALSLDGELEPADTARVAEKLGDVALLLGRIDRAVRAWGEAMEFQRGEEDLARVGDLHRKIGAGLWQKGDRDGAIEHYQRGIDLLKDGPPCIELVRLYEEAASLYMHTGDNMLAIYAAEKALRLAERLGEASAASRAHGIFGRVFGRIGDSERARENLERSVELARETDPAEAVRALFALGYHHEISEADYDAAREAYQRALELATEIGDLPSQVEVHAALGQLSVYAGDWEAASGCASASQELVEREGLAGKLCFPYAVRGAILWHEGDLDAAVEVLERSREIAEQVGRSEVAFDSLRWLAAAQRDRGDHADADATLAHALDLCERAGLVAQSIEATASRAVNLVLWGRAEAARELAAEAAGLAERLRYPVGRAASIEAGGAAAADPEERTRLLAEAARAWEELDRPVDAERCATLAGISSG